MNQGISRQARERSMRNFRVSLFVAAGLAALGIACCAPCAQAAVAVLPGSEFTFTGNAPSGSTVPTDPVDIALATNGATPFAISQYGGPHQIQYLNDGLYGNSNSWISAGLSDARNVDLGGSYGVVNMSFAGVALPSYSSTLYTLTGFTFGRSNLNEYGDRIGGTMYIQYAAAPSADLTNTDGAYDSLWTTIGSLTTTDVYDHVFSFTTPINAAGLRIVTQAGNCIDEIAMYGTVYVAGPTWTGGGTPSPTYDWSDAGNWGVTAPVNGDNVVLAGTNNTTTNNNITGLAVADISFNLDAGAFVNSGNSITLGGKIVNNSAAVQTISHGIGLTGAGSNQTINAKWGNIVINGAISDGDASAHGLVKEGDQTLTLAGTNNYSGATTVNAGTLELNGSLTSAVTVNSGGTAGGNGSYAGGLSILSGGKVAPGTETGIATLATSTLSLASGSILNFNIADTTNLDQITVSDSDGLTILGGGFNFYQGGSNTSPVNTPGTYDLLAYSGTLGGSVSNLSILNPAPGARYAFGTLNPGYVTLTIGQGPVWSGPNGGNWSVADNWGGAAPVPSDTLAYSAAGNAGDVSNNNTTGSSFQSIQFASDANAFTLTGNAVTLTGDLYGNIIQNDSANTQTVNLPIALGSSLAINTPSGDVVAGGEISGEGFGLTKIGDGTLIVSNVNTYSGLTNILVGTLKIGVADALPHGPDKGDVTLGSTLDLNGLGVTVNGFSGTGTVTNSAAGVGTLTVGDDDRNVSFTGTFDDGVGPVALKKIGSGRLFVSIEGSTYSGGTTVESGALEMDLLVDSSVLGTGPVTLMPGSVLYLNRNIVKNDLYITDARIEATNGYASDRLTGPVTLGGNVVIDVGDNGGIQIAGDVTGSGSLTLNGTRVIEMSALSGTNTYTGSTTINGVLKFINRVSLYNANASGTSWTADNLIVTAGSTAVFAVGGVGQFTSADIEALTALGSDTGGFASGSFICFDTRGGDFTCTSNIDNPNGGANVLGLSKFDPYWPDPTTLTLTGDNTYTGQTIIYKGAISVSSINSVFTDAELGTVHSASSNLGAPTTVANGTIVIGANQYGATGRLIYTGTGETTDRVIAFSTEGDSAVILDQSGPTGLLKFTSDLIVGTRAGKTITFQGSTYGTAEFAGVISGSGNRVIKNGTGTWTLSAVNTYTGATTINAGTLRVGSIDSSDVTVNSTGRLAGDGSVKSLIVNTGGKVAPGDGTRTLTVGGGDVSMAANAVFEWAFDGTNGGMVDITTGGLTLNDNWKVKLVDAGGDAPNGMVQYDLFTFAGAYVGLGDFGIANIDDTEVDWDTSGAQIIVEAGRVYLIGVGISSLTSDTNLDGVVDAADFITLKQNFGAGVGGGVAVGDFDDSGTVDWADLSTLMANMGNGGPVFATTPEPCSAMLLMFGAASLLRRRARIGRAGR